MSSVSVLPDTIRFAGYKLDVEEILPIKLLNKSNGMTRLRIDNNNLPTSLTSKKTITGTQKHKNDYVDDSSAFILHGDLASGVLVPGKAHNLELKFKPKELNYFYDKFFIITSDPHKKLRIPVHAYPTVSPSAFPKLINFGSLIFNQTK